ncbi:MAG TPA: histidine kinase N-terminal 7TM domain-containing protein [Anaerolineaceae bacterium]|nr:histidine kinase N-terminal 7TM domain-containing protein [Anaerolineaceae bacterium]HPN51964.1 histidine kinase N-terminal 7TM domain-containing protein [Anaerolineaceae bacterium]
MYEFRSYSFLFFLTLPIGLAMIAFAWRRRSIAAARWLILFELAAIGWALPIGFEVAAWEEVHKYFWSVLAYPGTVGAPLFFFLFSLAYTGKTRFLSPRWLFAYAIIPIISVLFAATYQWQDWLWTGMTIDPVTHIAVYGHGWWFGIMAGYLYLLQFIGIGLLLQSIFTVSSGFHSQHIILVAAIILSLISNFVYISNINPLPGLDWTPLSFAVGGALLIIPISRQKFLDVVPVARNLLIEKMKVGMLVVDERERVADINQAAIKMMGLTTSPVGTRIFDIIPEAYHGLVTTYKHQEGNFEIAVPVERPFFVDVRIEPLIQTGEESAGWLITLTDITRRKMIEGELKELNASLEDKVVERTLELQDTVEQLKKEIVARQKAEVDLNNVKESLARRLSAQSYKLAAIYDVILISSQSTSMQFIMEQSLDKVLSVTNASAACIHHWNGNGNLVILAQKGLREPEAAQMMALPFAWLMDEEIPYITPHISSDQMLPDPLHLARFETYLGASIHLRQEHIGLLSVFWQESYHVPIEDIALFSAAADQLGMIMENVRLKEQMEQMVVQRERRRLARDLHDSVTQSLHSLVLAADTASSRLKAGRMDRLEASVDLMASAARQALKEMRLLLYELRLASLDEVNMLEAVRIRLDSVEKRAGLDVVIETEGIMNWPPEWEGDLYCIAMEALNNSLKYSQASQVKFKLKNFDNNVELEIVDNGIGFDLQTNRQGIGLISMRERAERLGGKVDIVTQPGQGTQIRFKAPYNIRLD